MKVRALTRLAVPFALLCLIALVGCNDHTHTSDTPTQPPVISDTTIIVTSVVISSTAVAAPTSTTAPAIQPADTTGWTVYRDTRYPFRMPIPPGWQIFALSGSTPGTICSWYDVALFPPGSHPVKLEPLAETNPNAETIGITIAVGCQPQVPVSAPGSLPERQPISIGRQQATIYDDTASNGASLRGASATFGGLVYRFGIQTGTSDQRQDIALFLGMLKGFTFTGG